MCLPSLQARSSAERAKVQSRLAKDTGLHTLATPGFITLAVMLVLAYIGLAFTLNSVMSNAGIKQWDPYAILDVPRGANERAIRSAYRKLSVIHHPDKGGDEETFMNIAKAYKALTDEVARENYEKYNNPDGRQAMEVGLGLPSFMTEGENYNYIMLVYLLVLVVVVPIVMWFIYSANRGEDEKPHPLTAQWARFFLGGKGTSLPDLLTVYALSVEVASLQYVPSIDDGLVEALRKAVNKALPSGARLRPLPDFAKLPRLPPVPAPAVERNRLLLLAFVLRVDLDDCLEPAQAARAHDITQKLLAQSARVIRGLLAGCAGNNFPTLKMGKVSDKQLKRLQKQVKDAFRDKPVYNSEGLLAVLSLSQALVQRLWVRDPSSKDANLTLKQLPEFDDERCAAALPASKRGPAYNQGLLEYLNTPAGLRGGMDASAPEQRTELLSVMKAMPNLKVQVTVSDPRVVEGSDVTVGGTCLLRLKLSHLNMQADVLSGPLYTDAMAASGAQAGLVVSGGAGGSEALAAPKGVMHRHTAGPAEGVNAAAVLVDEADSADVADGRLLMPAMGTAEMMEEFEEEATPEVHAPYFPRAVNEKWWVVLLDENKHVVALDALGSSTAVMKKTMPFRAPIHPGTFEYTLHLICNAYVGLDHTVKFTLAAVPAEEAALQEEHTAQEDKEVMSERVVTLEEMMQGGTELVDDDSDEEEDEGEAAGVGLGAPRDHAEPEDDGDGGDGAPEEAMPQVETPEQMYERIARESGESVVTVRRRMKRKAAKAAKAVKSSADAPVVQGGDAQE